MLSAQSYASNKIGQFTTRLEGSLSSLEDFQSRKTELAVNLRNYEQQLVQLGRYLLADYREANRSARETPVPASFGSEFSFYEPLFEGGKIQNPDLDAQLRQNADLAEEAKAAAGAARASAVALQARIDKAISAAHRALDAGRSLRERKPS